MSLLNLAFSYWKFCFTNQDVFSYSVLLFLSTICSVTYFIIFVFNLFIYEYQDPCKFFNSKIDKKRLDTIFHATSGSKLITNCKVSLYFIYFN